MNDQRKYDTRVKMAGLWEKESAKGIRYFIGYCGAFKVLMLPDTNAGPDQPGWTLYAVEREQQGQQQGQQQGRGKWEGQARPQGQSWQRPAAQGQQQAQGRGNTPVDDDAPWSPNRLPY